MEPGQKDSVAEQRKAVLEQKTFVSGQISSLCRYIGFGLCAATFSLFTSTSSFAIAVVSEWMLRTALLVSTVMGVFAIFFDYLQFAAGFINVNAALDNEKGEFRYDNTLVSYKAREWFFYLKQAFVGIGVLFFLAALFEGFWVLPKTNPKNGAPAAPIVAPACYCYCLPEPHFHKK